MELVYPSTTRRLGAAVADGIVVILFAVLSLSITWKIVPLIFQISPSWLLDPADRKAVALFINFLLNLIFDVGFFSLVEGSFIQGSPGKVLFALSVVDEFGDPPTFLQALVRNISKALYLFATAAFLLPFGILKIGLPLPPERILAASPSLNFGVQVAGVILLLSAITFIRERMLYDFLSGTKVVLSARLRSR